MIVNRQKVMPVFSGLNVLVRTGSLFAGAYYFNFFTGLWLMVGSNILTLLFYNLYLVSQLKIYQQQNYPV
jgi:hypothetical protein